MTTEPRIPLRCIRATKRPNYVHNKEGRPGPPFFVDAIACYWEKSLRRVTEATVRW